MNQINWMSPDFGWPAPAKLNLFLHITGRRPDGYHNLQSIFQFVTAFDQLYFNIRQDGEIRRINDIPSVPEETDLTVRAARLLKSATGCPQGADIRIEKHLPMGGGLGGGSSDAATTLIALNRLWNTNLSTDELARLGLQLGADVPIFVHGHAAWAEGVGERLSPVQVPTPWYVILAPDVHVNTGKIFSHPELTRNQHPITIRDFLDGSAVNACQPLVERLFPEIREARMWLEKYAPARMTGTGACVFAPFPNQAAAADCAIKAPAKWRAIVAQGINETPLYQLFK